MARIKTIFSIGLALTLLLLSGGSILPTKVSALSGADFQAGRIIDDAVFFNPSSMTPLDIQTFLNSKVPACDTNGTQPYGGTTRAAYSASKGYPAPFTCLKDYTQTVPTMPGDAYCGGTVTAGSKSSAQIIYDVSQACGVSPKVLLILLQKEQGLVTDDWPWSVQFTKATGYACPDSALGTDVDANQNGCYDEYEGFFKQIYYGARQYQKYVKQANLFNFRAGATSYVQYNPDDTTTDGTPACGGTNVTIQNQATAGLYNYTPYQPNAAALNNLYGTGDRCSAYGNRNFWRMYIDWFGSPNSNTPFAWSYEGQWAYADAARTQQFSSVPTVSPGGKIYVRVKARNMGNQAWDQSFLHMGTSRPIDTPNQFYSSADWLSNTRAAKLVEASIAPGQIGTFDFTLQAPTTIGTYYQYFNLVAEGRTWLNDLGLFFGLNVNDSTTATNTINTSLVSGQSINRDDYLLSPDSQSALALQRDGNLVLYSNFKNIWNTGPLGSAASRLTLQSDGNLVLYNSSSQALWNTQTQGNAGAHLEMQTDGNLVLYSSTNSVLWATYTSHIPDHLAYINTSLPTGFMFPGQSIETADRRYKLILQRDGNLVFYSPTKPLWATGTDGKSILFLAMQSDGNLVLYDKTAKPVWYTGTPGYGPSKLVSQQDGNLVLYTGWGKPLWNTATAGN
jgi:hypothetical protein